MPVYTGHLHAVLPSGPGPFKHIFLVLENSSEAPRYLKIKIFFSFSSQVPQAQLAMQKLPGVTRAQANYKKSVPIFISFFFFRLSSVK
jgi:hypothetical protein